MTSKVIISRLLSGPNANEYRNKEIVHMNLWQRDGAGVRGLDQRSYGLDIWGSGISSGDDIIYSCSMPCKIIDPFIPIVE